MSFKKNFIKLSVLMLCFCFIFCGCRKNPTDLSSAASGVSGNSTEKGELTVSAENSSAEKEESSVSGSSSSSKNQNTVSDGAVKKNLNPKESGKSVALKGIDVSKWQGKIDWKKVKGDGIDFAIIRIGQRGENGKIVKDSNADYNIQQADKNGLLVGVYFFSTAISTAEASEEAQWVSSMIKSYPISFPIAWDCEGFSQSESRMYNLTKEQRTENGLTFLNKIKALGYEGMFYGSATELSSSLKWNTEKIEQAFKVWVAAYPSVTYPQINYPEYSGNYCMWQYTDKGKVSGIKGDVDRVVSYFSVKKAAPKSKESAPAAPIPDENDGIYTKVNQKVTAKKEVNLRESASFNSKVVALLKNGEVVLKVAEGVNGWSKLEYQGKTVYAVSSYLTDDLSYKPPEEPPADGFKKVNEKVTAKDKTNLRTVPNSSDSSTIVYTLKNGETVLRIGISDNGWSKLEYNGKTVYAVSSYLTTDLSYKPKTESTENTSSQLKTVFTEVNEQVTAKSETNLRTLPSVSDSEVVYTLKNGEFVTRTGVSENGWSRLEYQGKTVYAVSSYLTK